MRFIGLYPVKYRKAAFISSLFMLSLIVASCAGNAAVNPVENAGITTSELKQISKLAVSEDENGVYLLVEGSQGLLFSDIRKASPPEVTFYFPATQLSGIDAQYDVTIDPVDRINTSEVVADGHTAKIVVSLTKDAVYSVDQGLSLIHI